MSTELRAEIAGEAEGGQKTPPQLGPWQFSLSGMFAGVTAICVLFALMGTVGAAGGVFIALLVVLILAHVIGNAVGTRLRDDADRQIRKELERRQETSRLSAIPPPTNATAPVKLHENTRVGPEMIAVGIVGATAGGLFGLCSLWHVATGLGVTIGATSTAIIAGLFSFAAASFIQMIWRAIAEAHKG